MSQKTLSSAPRLGSISRADRIQRLTVGSALMLLTIIGFGDQVNWRGILALALQAELLLTGIAGWCPIYWACHVQPHQER